MVLLGFFHRKHASIHIGDKKTLEEVSEFHFQGQRVLHNKGQIGSMWASYNITDPYFPASSGGHACTPAEEY